MILYFSGTGNSEYAAKRIGSELHDEVVNLFEKIRSRDFTPVHSDRPWVVVVPTYAWRIPRIVQHWLESTPLTGSREHYWVMTCGGSIGNAGQYLQRLCDRMEWINHGCMEVVMPENYIAMFTTPPREEALEIIRRAEAPIELAAERIRAGQPFPQHAVSWMDRLNSSLVNDVFYPLFVHAGRFYATDACISCGKCVRVCPLNNVQLTGGRPVWGRDCTHCMACICRCPAEAIEYGKHSRGLPRYTCPDIA